MYVYLFIISYNFFLFFLKVKEKSFSTLNFITLGDLPKGISRYT